MKIKEAIITCTEQDVEAKIIFDRKEWLLHVVTQNGKVVGGFNTITTAQLKYHDYSSQSRKKNFEIIKKHVEKMLANQRTEPRTERRNGSR